MGNKRKKRSSLSEECPKKNTEGEKGEQLIMKESKKRRIEETNEKIEENGHQLDEISVEDFNEDNERLEIDDENSSKQKIKDKEAGKEHETEFREKDQSLPQSNSFFSEIEFNDLPICEPLKEALVTMNMKTLTEIQVGTIRIESRTRRWYFGTSILLIADIVPWAYFPVSFGFRLSPFQYSWRVVMY